MRDVFREWPGALRGSNYRADRRTSCARSINMQPTPIEGEDPSAAGGRRRQVFLAPTPGAFTSASGRQWLPKHPPRGILAASSLFIVAGARRAEDGAHDPGTLYDSLADPVVAVGDLAGSVTTSELDRAWPPLVQMAWGGPQIGIIAVAANGKLAYYDERIAAANADKAPGDRAAAGTPGAGWFNDVLGQALDSNVIGVQFFENYCLILDDRNRLFASPVLARNTDGDGELASLTREMIDHDDNTSTPDVPGQIPRYKFDLAQVVQRSLEPDPWVAMLALSDRLLMFGETTMGTWQLRANPGTRFPLTRIVGGQHQVGVLGQGAMAALADRAYWVGRSPDGQTRAWRYVDDSVEPISTAAVDEYLANLSGRAQQRARCTATAIAGRSCFAMRIADRRNPDGSPTALYNRLDATWCFDETVDMWHERGQWRASRDGPGKGGWFQWEVVFAAALGRLTYIVAEEPYNGRTVVGYLTVDRTRPDGQGNVWADAILTGRTRDGTNPTRAPNLVYPSTSGIIRRERVTPHWGTRATIFSIRGVKVSMGEGGGDVLLSVSKDGGQTYSLLDLRQTPSLGADELRWFALGQGRDPVLRITMPGRAAALNNVWANMLRLRG